MTTQVLSLEGTHAVPQGDTSPAIVVLSSSLVVLYANRGGTAVLRELKGSEEESSLQIPAPVLAYLADGILKNIDVRRMSRVYTPFSIICSIQGPSRIWYCQAFGLPSADEIDRSRIVLLFSDKPARGGTPERRNLVPTSSSPLPLLGTLVLETNVS
jgi:hypothetical protein